VRAVRERATNFQLQWNRQLLARRNFSLKKKKKELATGYCSHLARKRGWRKKESRGGGERERERASERE
jgi:hypothetical protein